MAIDFYWGSGSPYCWRVALALEYKGLAYDSRELHFELQEHPIAADAGAELSRATAGVARQ